MKEGDVLMKYLNLETRMKKAIFLLCLTMILCTALFAYVRSSANYKASIDSVTAAGEASGSSSYNIPQSAIDYGSGKSSSASYSMQMGVVQPVSKPSGVNDWKQIQR